MPRCRPPRKSSHKSTKTQLTQQQKARRYSPRAALAAIGAHVRAIKLLDPIKQKVVILQKSIRYTPFQKLTDALITILAGAHGLSEINTRLRSDEALQRAFGRSGCAEQSVVQETLSACTELNLQQMRQAMDEIFRQHARAFRHNYEENLQLLDIDMSGMPCGPQQEESRKGYFSEAGIRYGRQLGRVVATHYEEIVTDRLFAGNVQLIPALPSLIEAAEATLELDEARRRRTVLRMDAGAGSVDAINWVLERGYQVHGKDMSSVRAAGLAQSVTEWFTCPRRPGREMGWVTVEASDYVRPLRRLAMRWRLRNGQWKYALLLSTLAPREVMQLLKQPVDRVNDQRAVAAAYAKLYDLRGGAIEIEFKEDKQGFGMTKRSKKKFTAQQMVMLLGQLAHNVVVWARQWLSKSNPQLLRFGVLRFVRDVFSTSGFIEFAADGAIKAVVLNCAAPAARRSAEALSILLQTNRIRVRLGQT
jgi:hypothetical protein